MTIFLYRGEIGLLDRPTPRGFPGVYFFTGNDMHRAKGYARQDGQRGYLRVISITSSQYDRLADITNDRVYNTLLPNKDDQSHKTTRGVMPSKELCAALKKHKFIGFRWRDHGKTEIFILAEYCSSLRYLSYYEAM